MKIVNERRMGDGNQVELVVEEGGSAYIVIVYKSEEKSEDGDVVAVFRAWMHDSVDGVDVSISGTSSSREEAIMFMFMARSIKVADEMNTHNCVLHSVPRGTSTISRR